MDKQEAIIELIDQSNRRQSPTSFKRAVRACKVLELDTCASKAALYRLWYPDAWIDKQYGPLEQPDV